MTLSVVIVNYNVKYFLEHCLHAAGRALSNITGELIVVDNNSSDGSMDYLRCRFPHVKFIASEKNLGFAKACNEGLKHSSGQYILFLNPDTLVAEDSFEKCLSFFNDHPRCGALGVKMVDGAGRFLKESKRAFPSPTTSFYKLVGLGKLFPDSPVFGRYHLGHLDDDQTHEVDVLAGAFMMVPRTVLDKVGSFDEKFFMYGEDVDLSYRIQQGGWSNYYYPGITIIHFKGESTRRGSLNYVRMFYQAMSIFVQKHYGGTRAGIFNFSIQIAIWLRAGVAGIGKLLGRAGLGVLDALLLLASFLFAKEIWVRIFKPDLVLPQNVLWLTLPLLTASFIAAAYYAGLYDRFFRLRNLLRAALVALAAVLVVYSLLPEGLRFSRAVVIAGSVFGALLIWLQRQAFHQAGWLPRAADDRPKPYILVAASPAEYAETVQLLSQAGVASKIIGRISEEPHAPDAIGDLANLEKSARLLDAREIVFCAGELPYARIIEKVVQLDARHAVRFHAAGAQSIVGSDASDDSGQALAADSGFQLANPSLRRLKRLFDVLLSLLLLASFPVQALWVKSLRGMLRNCWQVLWGEKTWVGYLLPGDENLPPLRAGILTHNGPLLYGESLPATSLKQMDYWYARNYDPAHDLRTIGRYYRWLGS